MDFEYVFASLYIGIVYRYLSVESSRTEKSRVEYVGSVCRSYYNDTVVASETVHLYKKLV